MDISFSEHPFWRREHIFLLIVSLWTLGRHPSDGTRSRILKSGLFFPLPLLNPQPLSQFGFTSQETKCDFVLAGIWLSLGLFGRHWEAHASDEEENQEGTKVAHFLATSALTNMPLLRCHSIGSPVLCWNEEQIYGSISTGCKEFATNARRITCRLMD
jgi:hypothetical protein